MAKVDIEMTRTMREAAPIRVVMGFIPWSSRTPTRPSGTHARPRPGSAAMGSLGGDTLTLWRRGLDPARTNRDLALPYCSPRPRSRPCSRSLVVAAIGVRSHSSPVSGHKPYLPPSLSGRASVVASPAAPLAGPVAWGADLLAAATASLVGGLGRLLGLGRDHPGRARAQASMPKDAGERALRGRRQQHHLHLQCRSGSLTLIAH